MTYSVSIVKVLIDYSAVLPNMYALCNVQIRLSTSMTSYIYNFVMVKI